MGIGASGTSHGLNITSFTRLSILNNALHAWEVLSEALLTFLCFLKKLRLAL